MEKRTRRSRSEVLQDKLAKLNADKEKYTQKLDSITKQIEELQEELNAQRIDEVLSVIQEQGLSIDQAIEKLRGWFPPYRVISSVLRNPETIISAISTTEKSNTEIPLFR